MLNVFILKINQAAIFVIVFVFVYVFVSVFVFVFAKCFYTNDQSDVRGLEGNNWFTKRMEIINNNITYRDNPNLKTWATSNLLCFEMLYMVMFDTIDLVSFVSLSCLGSLAQWGFKFWWSRGPDSGNLPFALSDVISSEYPIKQCSVNTSSNLPRVRCNNNKMSKMEYCSERGKFRLIPFLWRDNSELGF